LEALAYAAWIADSLDAAPPGPILPESGGLKAQSSDLSEIRAIMESRVGVVRDAAGLGEAVARLAPMARAGSEAALTGLMIAHAALGRQESRGAHWRADFPAAKPPHHTETTLAALLAATETRATAEEALTP
ncbi:MAG TPA: L-aspartate oxidase, partial [Methylobacterium sp.]|nr:L-aspartate oxidase [Methylobacterium sp.]